MNKLIKNKLVSLILLISLVWVIYYPALWNDYVWDDVIIFVDRDFWHSDHSLWYIISQPVLEGTSYFRPLVFATFVAEFQLFGLKPFISHSINICILSCNVAFVYIISRHCAITLKRKNDYLYGLIVSLLYLTSPILVESTVWAVGRFDLMVTTFILICIFVFLMIKENIILRNILLNIFFIMGLFCKELAIVIPGILFIFYLALDQNKSNIQGIIKFIKKEWPLIFILSSTLLIYLSIRIVTMDQIYHGVNHNLSEPLLNIPYIHVIFPLTTLAEYLKTFIIPFYPNAIHQIDYNFISDWRGKFASSLALLFLLSILYGVVSKKSFSAYMALCSLLCLLPVLRIIPLAVPETIIHERFMTTALFFILMSVVFLPWDIIFEKLHILRLKKILLSMLILFYITFGLLGVKVTIPMWQNNLILWKWAYEKNKTSEIALQSYITYLYEYKKYPEFVKIIDERRSDITMKGEVLYYAYLLEHKDPETKLYIDAMIQSLNPLHSMIKNREDYHVRDPRLTEIGSIYHLDSYYYVVMGKDLEKALDSINIALWYDPENKQYNLLKSIIFLGLGKEKESEEFWLKATSSLHISKLRAFKMQREDLISLMCKDNLIAIRGKCEVLRE